ncbi:hypothetical protein BUALT_Bualt17G0036100 [Buddleja alternifolia]|uniref:Zinc knuckle CX2CX4HX4C domain-containing protein n=1 Tax=Buddleja alternifolia TaxID=168488 RepID=A0AAV6W7G7_9LAMI|nr:hypothetical protein BUALT_Bualt17G0036100 [Buddleja alternifolia]
MDVTKPLYRFMILQSPDGPEVKVTFAYEKFANFCYLCGKLAHLSDSCELRYEDGFEDPGNDIPYTPDLRAPPPRRFPPSTIRLAVSEGTSWRSSKSSERGKEKWKPGLAGSSSRL